MNFHSRSVTGVIDSRLPRRNTIKSRNGPPACARNVSSVTGRANLESSWTVTWYQRGFAR